MERRDQEDAQARLHGVGYISAAIDDLKKQIACIAEAVKPPQTHVERFSEGEAQDIGQFPLKIHQLPTTRPYTSVVNQVSRIISLTPMLLICA